MSVGRWQKIKELTKKDESIYTRVSLIYQQHHFPVDIREHFSEWFEQQEWINMDVDDSQDPDDEVYKYADKLLKDLLSRIDVMAKSMRDLVAKISLRNSHSTLSERFHSSPLEFFTTVKRCMEAEIILLDSMQDDEELRHNQALSADTEQKREFQKRIDSLLLLIDSQLKPLVQNVERQFEQMKQKHNKFLIEDRERDSKLTQLQHLIGIDGANKESTKKQFEALQKKKLEDTQSVISTQARIRQESNDAAESLAGVLKQAWELLDVWLTHQKLEMTCLTPPPEMAQLDQLDNIYKNTNEQFLRVMQLQDRIQDEFDRVVIQNPNFSVINADLTNNLRIILEKHIDRMFVVERQPQRINKITSGKSLQYNMIVRMLGGASLGMDLAPSKVIARIFPEKDGVLKNALEYQGPHDDPKSIPHGIAEVGNGACTFEKQRATGNLIAVFNSYQLRKVKRIMNERIGREERVTDQKYAMVYYTKVRVMNQEYQLKVISLPICLNTSNSQEGPSRGTLIWEAAFPVLERDPWSFSDRETVLWPEVVRVINALFERQTERALSPEQLGYLAERLMDAKIGTEESKMRNMAVSKDKFLKDNLPGCGFTFWKWVYACLNLIRMRLKSEWKDGLIFGFIGRRLTKVLLRGQAQGTFLLRFSDTSIEDTQSSEVPGCITVAVVHENPKKLGKKKVTFVTDFLKVEYLRKHGLAAILDGYCFRDPQNRDVSKALITTVMTADKATKIFEEAFKNYLYQKEEKKDGYARTKMKIEVDLEDQEDTKEAPMSPESIISGTTVTESMSPGPSDLDVAMEIAYAQSPSMSDTSAISQALSPLVVTHDEDYSSVPALSPQDEESLLLMLNEQGIQLNPETPSQVLNLVTNRTPASQ